MEKEVIETKTTETKYFHAENVVKNIWTTIIGCILMGVSGFTFMVQWFVVLPVKPEVWQLISVFFLGFVMLFMRDNLKSYIDRFTNKKIDKV